MNTHVPELRDNVIMRALAKIRTLPGSPADPVSRPDAILSRSMGVSFRWSETLRSVREGEDQGARTRMLFNLLPVRTPLSYPIATTADQQTYLSGRKVFAVVRQTQPAKPVQDPDRVFSTESQSLQRVRRLKLSCPWKLETCHC